MNTVCLLDKSCKPCEGGVPPLTHDEIATYKQELKTNWDVQEARIQKQFQFKNFREAIAFINKVAEIAESEGHHPDLTILYNKVTVVLWTHAIGGLSENDFILAAKIEELK